MRSTDSRPPLVSRTESCATEATSAPATVSPARTRWTAPFGNRISAWRAELVPKTPSSDRLPREMRFVSTARFAPAAAKERRAPAGLALCVRGWLGAATATRRVCDDGRTISPAGPARTGSTATVARGRTGAATDAAAAGSAAGREALVAGRLGAELGEALAAPRAGAGRGSGGEARLSAAAETPDESEATRTGSASIAALIEGESG